VLEAVADVLREEHFIPVIFDFDRPDDKDLIETLLILAGMSAFIVVDISNPKSTPLELYAIATNYGVPIFPIMAAGPDAFSLLAPMRRLRWVFPLMSYSDAADLKARLPEEVILPARREIRRLRRMKAAVESRGSAVTRRPAARRSGAVPPRRGSSS
jgi:hypothetical protein